MATSPAPSSIPSPNPDQHRSARRYFQSVLPALSRASSSAGIYGTTAKVERGLNPDHDHGAAASLAPGEKPKLLTIADRLGTFRTRVGIDNAPVLTTASWFDRHARNIGLYDRICVAESKAHIFYNTFSFLINACLGLQIIVAAALTALGAGNGPHKAVTAFGALNTVIAGFLAYLKGSGLPNRIKFYEVEWTRLREYIEQRERDFCTEECTYDVETEIFIIERMYEQVCDEIEMNAPDGFTSVSDIGRRRENRPTRIQMAEAYRTQMADPYSATGQMRPGSSYPPNMPPRAVQRAVSMRAVSTKEKDKEDDVAHAV
jgi:hypothetical protein